MAASHEKSPQQTALAGLCATCRHARQITSARGSSFFLCQLSATDERFPKYPRLPVLRCPGFTPSRQSDGEAT